MESAEVRDVCSRRLLTFTMLATCAFLPTLVFVTLCYYEPSLPGKLNKLEVPGGDLFSVVKSTQDRRRALLAEMCEKYFPGQSNRTSALGASLMFTSNIQRYLYCEIPKCACTSWKRILSRANGAPELHKAVHNPQQIQRYLNIFGTLSADAKQRALTHYFKFMFVRHPLERLVSAYKDKFIDDRPDFRQLAKSIKLKYRTDKRLGDKRPPTFREFVMHIIDGTTHRPLNRHWRPYHELCQPCRINFDFIGHYETLTDDTRYVLDRLHIQEVQLPQPRISHNSSARVAYMFSQLSEDEIRRLVDIYRLDFALFGYSPDISEFIHK